jgi:amino acid permease
MPWKSYIVEGATGRFLAFWECSCRAMYSYTGPEILSIVASETRRQRETLPSAAKRISHRLIYYYVGAIIILTLNVSSLDPILSTRLSTDPARPYPGGFMVMLLRAGVPVLPHILNAVMIIASIGVANGEIFFTVNPTLVGLTGVESDFGSISQSGPSTGFPCKAGGRSLESTLFRSNWSCRARSTGISCTCSRCK